MDERLIKRIRAAVLACAALSPAAAAAGDGALWSGAAPSSSAAEEPPRVRPELMEGWTDAAGARVAGLALALAPGWKTYWRNPGDAGIPPQFDWSASDNVAAVEVVWPRPQSFDFYGYRTLGYKGDVVLPLQVTPQDPTRPVALRLTLDYGVCAEVCVPERAELSAELPAQTPRAADAPRIEAALARRILPAAEAALEVERCTIAGAGKSRRFEGAFRPATPFATPPQVVVEAGDEVWFAPAQVRIENGAVLVSAEMETLTEGAWVSREQIDVTLLGEDQAMIAPACGG